MTLNFTKSYGVSTKIIYIGIIFLLVLLGACDKADDDPELINDIEFTALQIENDSIYAGEETKIEAVATGTDIEYFWSATKGDILGSGKEVIYASSPCHIGTNTISCTVQNNSKNAETKTVKVVVLE